MPQQQTSSPAFARPERRPHVPCSVGCAPRGDLARPLAPDHRLHVCHDAGEVQERMHGAVQQHTCRCRRHEDLVRCLHQREEAARVERHRAPGRQRRRPAAVQLRRRRRPRRPDATRPGRVRHCRLELRNSPAGGRAAPGALHRGRGGRGAVATVHSCIGRTSLSRVSPLLKALGGVPTNSAFTPDPQHTPTDTFPSHQRFHQPRSRASFDPRAGVTLAQAPRPYRPCVNLTNGNSQPVRLPTGASVSMPSACLPTPPRARWTTRHARVCHDPRYRRPSTRAPMHPQPPRHHEQPRSYAPAPGAAQWAVPQAHAAPMAMRARRSTS